MIPASESSSKKANNKQEKTRIEHMFAGHLRREIYHVLIAQGQNLTID